MPNGQRYGQTIVDSGDEPTTFSVEIAQVTAISLPGLLTAATDFEEALYTTDFILGSMKRVFLTAYDNSPAYVIDTAANNQRGIKWLFKYHDSVTGSKYTAEIGTANLLKLPVVAGKRAEFVDITAGDGLTMKDAFEALVKSPSTHNTVILDSIGYVD